MHSCIVCMCGILWVYLFQDYYTMNCTCIIGAIQEAAKHATTKSLLCADKYSTLEILYIHLCVHTKAWE